MQSIDSCIANSTSLKLSIPCASVPSSEVAAGGAGAGGAWPSAVRLVMGCGGGEGAGLVVMGPGEGASSEACHTMSIQVKSRQRWCNCYVQLDVAHGEQPTPGLKL